MTGKIDRRRFLMQSTASVAAASFSKLPDTLAQPATRDTDGVNPELVNVKACVFDTFGTVVDWRGSVIAEASNWGKAKGLNINWAEFTDSWRLGYRPAMDKVRRGEIPWTTLDDLHRMILEDLLKQLQDRGTQRSRKGRLGACLATAEAMAGLR